MSYSATNEYRFWRLLRDKLRRDFHTTRIESVVSVGVPDVYFSSKNGSGDGWLELKVVHGTKVHFEKAQVSWIKQHAKTTTRIGILALKSMARGQKTIYLWDGSQVEQVKQEGTGCSPVRQWDTPFDWSAIVQELQRDWRVPEGPQEPADV